MVGFASIDFGISAFSPLTLHIERHLTVVIILAADLGNT